MVFSESGRSRGPYICRWDVADDPCPNFTPLLRFLLLVSSAMFCCFLVMVVLGEMSIPRVKRLHEVSMKLQNIACVSRSLPFVLGVVREPFFYRRPKFDHVLLFLTVVV